MDIEEKKNFIIQFIKKNAKNAFKKAPIYEFEINEFDSESEDDLTKSDIEYLDESD